MSLIRKPFRYTYLNATLIIVGANIAVFIATGIFPQLYSYLGLSVINCVAYRMWWQPITYMFMHSGFRHILFNMLGILMFGLQVERAIGSKEFILFYFLCGILDGIISLALYFCTSFYYVNLIGASGALYSILLIFAVIFPKSIIRIYGIIPVPAPLLVLGYAVIELGSHFYGGGNVAHLTHLTGLAVAWLYLIIRMGVHPIKIWKNAWFN